MTTTATDDTRERLDRLQATIEDLLKEAKRRGADAAEAVVSGSAGLEIAVRLGEVETVEHTRDNGLSLTVYFGQSKGCASTSDLSSEAVREAVRAACAIASHTQADPCAGLADPQRLATRVMDLDLYHPWDLPVEEAVRRAVACEDAARASDPRITNSEGASLSSHFGVQVYGNSHGFVGGYPAPAMG